MTRISMTDARHYFTEIANEVIFHGERVYIEKNHKPVFAIVPIEDAEALEALEDKIDIELARKALKSGKFISLGELKKQLGL